MNWSFWMIGVGLAILVLFGLRRTPSARRTTAPLHMPIVEQVILPRLAARDQVLYLSKEGRARGKARVVVPSTPRGLITLRVGHPHNAPFSVEPQRITAVIRGG